MTKNEELHIFSEEKNENYEEKYKILLKKYNELIGKKVKKIKTFKN